MTIEKKLSTATELAAGSNYVAADNDRFARVETAAWGAGSLAVSGTAVTFTAAQIENAGVIRLTGAPGGAATVTLPAVQRWLTFINETGEEVSFKIAGQPGDLPTMPPLTANTDEAWPYSSGTLWLDGTKAAWLTPPSFMMTAAEYTALATKDPGAIYETI
jgi:hypothetical protein